MWVITLSLALLLVSLLMAPALADPEIRLGDKQRTADLFSHPNNCNTVCYRPWSLERTVEHYLNDTLRRDGFPNTSARLKLKNDIYFAEIVGPEPPGFVQRYKQFLALGDIALNSARTFNSTGKWRYDWRFLLPVGLPMVNNRTLEVMDFPPLTLLLERQDYLNSNTTNRWTALLGENGVSRAEYDFYGAILDIVPVAAPAGDGVRLEEAGIYDGPFDNYALPLIELWTKGISPSQSKPIMALGAPIRTWFKRIYNLDVGILDIGRVTFANGRTSPVMGMNHPSFFFYAANKFTSGPDKDEKNFALGMAVMKQDIVAACWQAEMGKAPSTDALQMKASCETRWIGRDRRLCELVEMQAYRKSEDKAKASCATRTFPGRFAPSHVDLQQTEKEFFATSK